MKKKVFIISLLLSLCSFVNAQVVDSTKAPIVDECVNKAQDFYAVGNLDSILHYYNKGLETAKTYNLKNKAADVYYELAKLYMGNHRGQ